MRTFAWMLLAVILVWPLAGCGGSDEGEDAAAVPATAEQADEAATQEEAAPTEAEAEAGSPETGGDANLVARVNGQDIALGDFQRQVFEAQHYYVEQGLDPNTEEGQRQLLDLRRQILREMIHQVLIEQGAAEAGITVTDEEVAERWELYVKEFGDEASLAEHGTTREEVEASERAALIAGKMLDVIAADVDTQNVEFANVRHILCKESEAACQDALARIRSGEDFASVAAEVSEDETTKERGGDLGWMGRGLVPSQALEDAIFSLSAGELSEVIQTEYGYHVVEMIERDDSRELEDDQVYAAREKALMDWLEARKAESTIEIYIDDLADVAGS